MICATASGSTTLRRIQLQKVADLDQAGSDFDKSEIETWILIELLTMSSA